jgi:hypothetical protein
MVSQLSPQLRQMTPLSDRQAWVMVTSRDQGLSHSISKAPWRQASIQPRQNVQRPREKSTLGNPACPRNRICSGQALIQSSQRWQRSVKSVSVLDQGGRISLRPPLRSPRRNWALLLAFVTVHLAWVSSVSSVQDMGFDVDQGLIERYQKKSKKNSVLPIIW